MYLAHELKMSIDECLQSHSQRQLRIWLEWFNLQLRQPSKDNLYAMQIACEVRRVLSSKPNSIKIDDFKIRFKDKQSIDIDRGSNSQEDSHLSKQSLSKSIWLGYMKGPITYKGKQVKASDIPR